MAVYINLTTGQMANVPTLGMVPFTGQSLAPEAPIVPNTPVTPTPTTSDIYSGIDYETPEERAFREAQAQQMMDQANLPIDENAIRQQTQARFQAEIDALNRVYAEKARQEGIAGQGRLGSAGAVQARRGLLGSDFGAAQTAGQQVANQEAMSAIESERAYKESGILSQARNLATAEIEKKTEAKRLGAESYLAYISGQKETRKTNTKAVAKMLYDNEAFETEDLNAIAKELGVSVESLKAEYNDYKKTADAQQAKAKAEAEKLALDTRKTEADIAKTEADTKTPQSELVARETGLLKEGYSYVQTPAERDQLIKQGYDISIIGGRTYAKAPKLTTKTVKVGYTTYSITTNEAGDVVKKTVVAGGGGSGVPSSNPSEKTAITEMTGAMSQVVGADGYISPQDYTELRKQWADAGMNTTTFDTKFKGYRNPNNPNYVTVKQ